MKKYCSHCKQSLANNNCIVCDKCGKPTTPVDIFDKMASDNCLNSKEKRMLELTGILKLSRKRTLLIEKRPLFVV